MDFHGKDLFDVPDPAAVASFQFLPNSIGILYSDPAVGGAVGSFVITRPYVFDADDFI